MAVNMEPGPTRSSRPHPVLYLPFPPQRLIQADLELRQLLPEAEALIGGPGSAKELALEARVRLVKNRQQVCGCRFSLPLWTFHAVFLFLVIFSLHAHMFEIL